MKDDWDEKDELRKLKDELRKLIAQRDQDPLSVAIRRPREMVEWLAAMQALANIEIDDTGENHDHSN